MNHACAVGVKSDEIRRVLKVIEDQEFPDELVKRLYSQPAQLSSLYGICMLRIDGLLKVLKSLSDSAEDSKAFASQQDDPCGCPLSSLDTFLFEMPHIGEDFEEELKYFEEVDGSPIEDESIILKAHSEQPFM